MSDLAKVKEITQACCDTLAELLDEAGQKWEFSILLLPDNPQKDDPTVLVMGSLAPDRMRQAMEAMLKSLSEERARVLAEQGKLAMSKAGGRG